MTWHLEIENIAGIRSGQPTLHPGLNTIQASNWQGKTSLIKALETVMGPAKALQDGADEGRVELTVIDDDTSETTTYEVTLNSRGETITRSGTPYLTDERDRVLATLFAFLGEDNPIRDAVRQGPGNETEHGDTLVDLLLQPVNMEDIEDEIEKLQEERTQIDAQIKETEQAQRQLPDQQEKVTRLENELKEIEAELEAVRDEIQDTPDEDSVQEELRDKRQSKRNVERRIKTLKDQIEQREAEIDAKQEELDAIEIEAASESDQDVDELKVERNRIENELNTLQEIRRINQQILNQNQLDLVTEISVSVESLTEGDEFECWVCGGQTSEQQVREQLTALQDPIEEREARIDELDDRIQGIQDEKERIRDQRQTKNRLEREIQSLKENLSEDRTELKDRQERLDTLTDEISALEDELEAADSRRNELERERAKAESDLEQAQEKLADIKVTAEELDALESEREDLTGEINDLRERRRDQINTLIEEIQTAMDDITEHFGPTFEHVRVEKFTDEKTGQIEDLELTVIRGNAEVGVDSLSEGEIELLGFLFAVAGYRAFDVNEIVPCILIDEVGGLAAEHLHTLTDYLATETEYIVSTAYPEAGSFEGHTLNPTDWDVMSDRAAPA